MFLVWKPGMAPGDDLPVCDIWPACTASDDPDGCFACQLASQALKGARL